MKISLWAIGKNHEAYIKEGTEEFTKRISRYFSIDWNIIPVPKNAAMLSEMDLKKKRSRSYFAMAAPRRFPGGLRRKRQTINFRRHGKPYTNTNQ